MLERYIRAIAGSFVLLSPPFLQNLFPLSKMMAVKKLKSNYLKLSRRQVV